MIATTVNVQLRDTNFQDVTHQKKLLTLLSELKKSANNAKSAEMINTKKLRQVAESINALDDEIHRKINISKSFSEKNFISIS